MCAIAVGARSTERRVVAFVLAGPVLLNVRGLDVNDEDDFDGTGDGGQVGGIGRVEASSSASTVFEFRQVEPMDGTERCSDCATSSSPDKADGAGLKLCCLAACGGRSAGSAIRGAADRCEPPSLRCSQVIIGLFAFLFIFLICCWAMADGGHDTRDRCCSKRG
jgi:hypothetical protein